MLHSKRMRSGLAIVGLLTLLVAVVGCGQGTSSRPAAQPGGQAPAPTPAKKEPVTLKMGFVPSQNAEKLAETVKPLGDMLQKQLGEGHVVETFVAANFAGLVEAMGSGKADIGFLNPFAYVLAHDLNGAEVMFKAIRTGSAFYRAQFMTYPGSGITKIEDLKGKKMGFGDPNSTSSYLFPAALMKEKGIDPEKDVKGTFLGGHDAVAKAVMRKDVDAGVAFEDIRDRLLKEFPDVKEKVTVFAYTDKIPNDTISVRKGLDPALKARLADAFKKIAADEQGKKLLKEIYTWDGMEEAKDSDYDIVRKVQKAMDIKVK